MSGMLFTLHRCECKLVLATCLNGMFWKLSLYAWFVHNVVCAIYAYFDAKWNAVLLYTFATLNFGIDLV